MFLIKNDSLLAMPERLQYLAPTIQYTIRFYIERYVYGTLRSWSNKLSLPMSTEYPMRIPVHEGFLGKSAVYGGNDLRNVIGWSQELKSEGVMDGESGESPVNDDVTCVVRRNEVEDDLRFCPRLNEMKENHKKPVNGHNYTRATAT